MNAAPIVPAEPAPRPMPRVPPPFFDEFPPELKRLPQWVGWRLEVKPNRTKFTKVPYMPAPTGMNVLGHASTTDSTTWRTLAECELICTFGKVDGVGFVFSAADPYCGVDLDDCRAPDTGTLDDWAKPLIEQAIALGLYIEVSVSGTGIHIIGRGRLGQGRRVGGVEMYDRDRFFTMSGDRTGYPDGSVEGNAQPLIEHIRATLLHDEPGIDITDAEVHRRRDGLALAHRARALDPNAVQAWTDDFAHRAGEEARGWWFTQDVEQRSEDRQALLWRIAKDRVTHGVIGGPEQLAIEVAAVVMQSERYAAETARGKWPRLLAMEVGKAAGKVWREHVRPADIVIELPAAAARDVPATGGHAPAIDPAPTAQEPQDGAGDRGTGSESSVSAAARPEPAVRADEAGPVEAHAADAAPTSVGLHAEQPRAPARLQGPWSQQTEAQRLGYPAPPAGPIADATEWIMGNATKEQPMLAMLSSLIAFSAACGSQYALRDGSRLNLYGIGVAPTAAGKDAPRSAALALTQEAGIPPITDIGSGQGLEDALIERQSIFAVIDEIGHFVRIVEGPKAPSHMVAASKLLLTMWTAGRQRYFRRVLAKGARQGDPGTNTVDNPMLSVLGFTTPTTLGQGLTSAAIESGLLGRMLFVTGEEKPFTKFMPTARPMPDSVAARMQAIYNARQDHKLHNVCVVEFEPAAESLSAQIMREREAERATLEPHAAAIVARAAEKVNRIAGVLAVIEDPVNPVIRVDHVRWADAFVRASDRAVIEFVNGRVHDSEMMEIVAKVRRTLLLALQGHYQVRGASEDALLKAGLVPRSLLVRATKLEARLVTQAIDHLVTANEVVKEQIDTQHPNGALIRTEGYRLA